MGDRQALGAWGEDLAVAHLEAAGYDVLARNWRCREGELDIVARGGDALVFVEVKTAQLARLRRSRGGGVAGQGPPDPGAGRALAQRVPAAGPARAALRRGVDRAQARPGPRPGAPRGCVLMPLAKSLAVALVGLDGHVVEVEADLAHGIPGLSITGLPDAALNEARDRVRAAVVNSGHPWPNKRVTLGLSPAALPKRGSGFDLALAGCPARRLRAGELRIPRGSAAARRARPRRAGQAGAWRAARTGRRCEGGHHAGDRADGQPRGGAAAA